MSLRNDVENLINEQLQQWPAAADNYAALADVKVKEFDVDGMHFKVQFNPARAVSSGAKVDAASIKARKCFLCAENRPDVQRGIAWGDDYTILLNPFPIFPRHLTIPCNSHVPQACEGSIADMLRLARELEGYTVFYNGPRCGASAPDHFHFQAGNSDFLPLARNLDGAEMKQLRTDGTSVLSLVDSLPIKMFVIDSVSPVDGEIMFTSLLRALPVVEGDYEPMLNLLAYAVGDGTRLVVVPRRRHRPSFYGTEGADCMMLSPASVDMGGVFITPRLQDFELLDSDTVRRVIAELCLSQSEVDVIAGKLVCNIEVEPVISVGIVSGRELHVDLKNTYTLGHDIKARGPQVFSLASGGKIQWQGREYDEIVLDPADSDCSFEVDDVVIGVNFHWERKERQRFIRSLKIIVEGDKLTLINLIPLEDYLKSVISSEMSATAGREFLMAHAVISRSWLIAQIRKSRSGAAKPCSATVTDDEIVRWYDREDHANFDVCADDHCQRYQGVTRQTTPAVGEAVDATRGLVLTDENGEVCDARFSKCCGGVFEEFENCWEPVPHSYLKARLDDADEDNYPDLRIEENARRWILGRPEAYCNTTDPAILGQVLNNYDQETADFYRWRVDYSQSTLSELIRQRSGIDFGGIVALEPVERGTSGRIVRLRIVGTKRTMIIGKELEIRRTLSPSHLYSSAFVVEASGADSNGLPEAFTLHGAGWGHGVGLCQIGAAVMGARGMAYRDILGHYFPGAVFTKAYS